MSAAFVAHLHDLLDGLGTVTVKHMFGGYGIYLDATMIGIVVEETLYLKVDAPTRPQFEAAGCAPFVYQGKNQPVTMSYWTVPPQAMESPSTMRPWAQLAHAAALRKPPAKRKK